MPSGNPTAQSQKIRICNTLLWILTSVLFIELAFAWYSSCDPVSNRQMHNVALCGITVCLSVIAFRINNEWAVTLSHIALVAMAGYEIVLGIMQMFGIASSEHAIYILTGSFPNPNPYAGFLAVLFCIILSIVLLDKCKIPWLACTFRITLYALAILIPITMCRSALIAMAIGTGFITFRYSIPVRKFIKKNGVYIVVAAIVILALLYLWKRNSANGRAFIYRIAVLTMLTNGFRGVGLGHYQWAATQTQINYFRDRIPFSNGQFYIPDSISRECLLSGNPDYAFCDPLQLGVEAGIITMITYICVILLTLIILYRSKPTLFYGLLAAQITSLVSYSMSLLFFQIFTAVCIGCALNGTARRTGTRTLAFQTAAGAFVCTLLLIALPYHRHSYNEWNENRVFYNSGANGLYADCCSQVEKELGYSWTFMYEYGDALAQTGNLEKSDSILLCGTQRFGNNAFYMLLGENAVARQDYTNAQDYYWNSFCISPHHLVPLYRLALMYNGQDNKEGFMNMYESIKRLNPKKDHEAKTRILDELEQISQTL